jgi:hypothetical protein
MIIMCFTVQRSYPVDLGHHLPTCCLAQTSLHTVPRHVNMEHAPRAGCLVFHGVGATIFTHALLSTHRSTGTPPPRRVKTGDASGVVYLVFHDVVAACEHCEMQNSGQCSFHYGHWARQRR